MDHVHVGVEIGAVAEPQVDVVAGKIDRIAFYPELDAQRLLVQRKSGEPWLQPAFGDGGDDADYEARLGAARHYLLGERRNRLQSVRGPGEHRLARIGQQHAIVESPKELLTQEFFQIADLLAHRRRRDAKLLGGGDVASGSRGT